MTPGQIRNRARRREGKLNVEIDNYMEHVAKKPIEEWDLEELARGRPRDVNGGWNGRTPTWLTPAIAREAKRRLMDHTFGTLAGHVDEAIKTIAKLLTDESVDEFGKPIVDARTKLAAAQFVVENVIGKPKAVVEVEATDLVRSFIAGALVMDDGEPAHPIIDGQFTDEGVEG
jgi:hypothetical protein